VERRPVLVDGLRNGTQAFTVYRLRVTAGRELLLPVGHLGSTMDVP
jgi:hypothetical protein